MRQKLWSITQSLRLPSLCALCNQFHKQSLAVCADCLQFLKPLGTSCQQCAYPLFDSDYPICGHCIKKPPHFDRAFIAYAFEEPLRGLLHQFKYYNGLYLSSFLCKIILNTLPQDALKTQCLIPIPMHSKRIKERGFNQAAILAKLLAKKLQLPYDLSSCKKIINHMPQAGLSGEQRQKNIKGSFICKSLPYSHVTLIDDLLTTGSTTNELAHTLKKMGVQQVDIWCCARTVIKN